MTSHPTVAIDEAEWRRVGHLTEAACPIETEGRCVWLSQNDGHRRWSALGQGVTWTLDADSPDQPHGDFEMPLPARAVWAAIDLAALDGRCNVTVEATTALLANSAGSAAIDLPAEATELSAPLLGVAAATATLTAERLAAVLAMADVRPPGVDRRTEFPRLWLAIEHGDVAVAVDWRPGGARSTFRAAAATNGTATASIYHWTLLRVLQLAGQAEVTLQIPENPLAAIAVSGDGWEAFVEQSDASTARHIPTLIAQLEALDVPYTDAGDGVFQVEVDGTRVRVALHPGRWELARCTLVIDPDVEPELTTLERVNDANVRMRGVRIWIDRRRLIAGIDLPCGRLDDLGSTLHHLVDEAIAYDAPDREPGGSR